MIITFMRRAVPSMSLLISCTAFGDSLSPLALAKRLLSDLTPANNVYYAPGSYVQWSGLNGNTVSKNQSVCSTFYSLLLKQSYAYTGDDLLNWFGSASPEAAVYHDAIVDGNHFKRLRRIRNVQPGDLIVIKYLDGTSGASAHLAIVSERPKLRYATEPTIDGTYQYEVKVIDSSQSGHGALDTRRQSNGTWDDGAGEGALRIYTDRKGYVQGYTWSTYANSKYYTQDDRHLVFGRFKPD